MRAKTGKTLFSANNEDDNKLKIEQNIPNSPIKAVDPIPDYDIGKNAYPAYSFPKDERF
jgi:hypothetical protein